MNMHVPLTLESVVELRYLASTPTQIVSPQASKPVMGMVQDSMLGNYLLTQNKQLTYQEMMRLMISTSSFSETLPPPVIGGADPRWTSQQLMSMFLPSISYKKGDVEIAAGKMSSGILNSGHVGKGFGSLFHITWNDHGPIMTRDLLNNLSFAANTWLTIRGFTCGIDDCVISDEAHAEIRKYIMDSKKVVSQSIQNAKMGNLPSGTNAFNYKKEFPKKIIDTMTESRLNSERYLEKNVPKSNHIDTMVRSGAKGNKTNMCQIVALLGQQQIEGNWIENQLHRRALPHFHKDDLRPESHGFVESSFMDGLNPAEYWAHAQEGRIGVITKAIKTAETGYIQRKLIKALEDVRICYDGSVRNANNMIIQTVYGADGFDASYLETQDISFINYNMERLCQKFKYVDYESELESYLTPQAYQDMMNVSKEERSSLIESEFSRIESYYHYLKTNVPASRLATGAKCPVKFERIIQNMGNQFHLKEQVVADLSPLYIIDKVNQLRDKIVVDPRPSVNYVNTVIFNSLMAFNLSSKVLITEYKFNRVAFDHLIDTLYVSFLKSLVNPGENVGIIAAQSLGEPTTQMALNTFHQTGQGSKANISRGTPRLKELMSLSRNIKLPSMTIYIQDDFFIQKNIDQTIKTENGNRASLMGAEIEHTVLRDLLVSTEIFYDEDDHHTCIQQDQEFVDSYYDLLPDIDQVQDLRSFKWLLRLEFDREAIMRKSIPMYLIEHRLREKLITEKVEHTLIVSDDNACKLICRIKVAPLEGNQDESNDPINYLRDLESNLLTVKIKGIEGIDRCLVNTVKKEIVLPNGKVLSPFDSDASAYDEATKQYNNVRYMLDTDGSNLLEVLPLPNVDMYKTVSNDVWEIYQLYGIEAARVCIISEINQLLEASGSSVQERHISLLVDVMTNQGTMVSVDRHGVNKTESGPLHRASFEETTAQLTNASIFSEVDMMTGVSGNIMFGQFIPSGTNAFNISMDIEKIKKQIPVKQSIAEPMMREEKKEVMDLSDFCNDDNFDFKFTLGSL
jgi:DNA-directed RNA polymerase II subunit RPB1